LHCGYRKVDAKGGMWRERDLSNDSVTAVGLTGRWWTLGDVGMLFRSGRIGNSKTAGAVVR
jgi:hypothetical protein